MNDLARQASSAMTELSTWQVRPCPRECLICYLMRLVAEHGCSGLRWSTHYRDMRAPRARALELRLAERGGYCDCEVLMNAVRPCHAEVGLDGLFGAAPPATAPLVPECLGVRRGSTQPCALWRWRRRGEPFDW